jgi:hypothetical protein
MTRTQILNTYKVEGGLIQDPGKFEGEPIYAPYFHDLIMNGDGEAVGETEDDNTMKFEVTPEDLEQFPELADVTAIYLSEDDQGFVWLVTE